MSSPILILSILVMQLENAFKCSELKTGRSPASWNLQVSKLRILVFLSLLNSLDSQLQGQLFVLVHNSAVGHRAVPDSDFSWLFLDALILKHLD